MKFNPKTKELLHQVSALLILAAAVLYYIIPDVARYIMLIGVAGFGAITFTSPYPGKSVRGKRLQNILIFAVILMIITAYLMFVYMSQWVIPLLISALLILYCSIVIPREYEKEKRDN